MLITIGTYRVKESKPLTHPPSPPTRDIHPESKRLDAPDLLQRAQKLFKKVWISLHVVTHLQKDMLITAEHIQKPTRQCPNLIEISWDIGKLIC